MEGMLGPNGGIVPTFIRISSPPNMTRVYQNNHSPQVTTSNVGVGCDM